MAGSSSRHSLRPVRSATHSAAAGRSEQLLRPDTGHQTSPAAGEHKYCHMGAYGGCTWQANIGQTGSRCDRGLCAVVQVRRVAGASETGAETWHGAHEPQQLRSRRDHRGAPRTVQGLHDLDDHGPDGLPAASHGVPTSWEAKCRGAVALRRVHAATAAPACDARRAATRPRRAKSAGCTTPYVGWRRV